jgi:hypothetical protein
MCCALFTVLHTMCTVLCCIVIQLQVQATANIDKEKGLYNGQSGVWNERRGCPT